MRRTLALVVLAACGRIGFDARGDAASGPTGDGSMAAPRCAVPQRPGVSNPRVTLGCDQIVAAQEVLTGGLIRFDCPAGLQFGSPMLVKQDTVIDGHGVVLDGQGITRLFVVNNNAKLTLLDVTVTRGTVANDNGGAIRVDSGRLTTFDSTFTDNHGPDASFSGGAISAQPPTATLAIYGGRFSNNTCASGGAVYAYSDLEIVNATFDNNAATGTGGDVGTGGDGAAVQMAGDGNVTLCGDTFSSNAAGHIGGGLVTISTSQTGIVQVTDVAFDSNRADGGGGGAYFQNYASLTLRRVSATNNAATNGGGGGLWMDGGAGMFDGENVSVVFNRADGGTGAGVFLGTNATGRFAFSTIADNVGGCTGCVASAIANGANLELRSTIVVDNVGPSAPKICSQTGTNGGATWQWPGDLPLCAAGATVTDPLLLPRAGASGPAGTLLVRRPAAGSPAIRAVSSGCPADDILGNPRPTPCAAGAVEP